MTKRAVVAAMVMLALAAAWPGAVQAQAPIKVGLLQGISGPFEVYAKALYEYFLGRDKSQTDWERNQSALYPVLSKYQQDGYRRALQIGRLPPVPRRNPVEDGLITFRISPQHGSHDGLV